MKISLQGHCTLHFIWLSAPLQAYTSFCLLNLLNYVPDSLIGLFQKNFNGVLVCPGREPLTCLVREERWTISFPDISVPSSLHFPRVVSELSHYLWRPLLNSSEWLVLLSQRSLRWSLELQSRGNLNAPPFPSLESSPLLTKDIHSHTFTQDLIKTLSSLVPNPLRWWLRVP